LTYGAPSNVEFSDISSVFSAIFDIILCDKKKENMVKRNDKYLFHDKRDEKTSSAVLLLTD